VAGWTQGGWRFVAAFEGMRVSIRSSGQTAIFASNGWMVGVLDVTSVRVGGVGVLGGHRPAIANAVGGGVQDVEARATLGLVLSALRAHGLIAT
jgi:hypothetical protein